MPTYSVTCRKSPSKTSSLKLTNRGFARDELKPGGSSAAQAEVESRRISRKYVPFRRFKGS